MADTDDMVNVAQGKLEQLVGQDAPSIGEAEETVVCKDSPQAHGARMEDGLMAQATKTGMSVYNLDALADYNIAKDGEEGEDGGEGCLAIDDPEGDVVDLEAIGQVSHAFPAGIGMCDDNNFMSPIDEFLHVLGDDFDQQFQVSSRLTVGTCDSRPLL